MTLKKNLAKRGMWQMFTHTEMFALLQLCDIDAATTLDCCVLANALLLSCLLLAEP